MPGVARERCALVAGARRRRHVLQAGLLVDPRLGRLAGLVDIEKVLQALGVAARGRLLGSKFGVSKIICERIFTIRNTTRKKKGTRKERGARDDAQVVNIKTFTPYAAPANANAGLRINVVVKASFG